ncbi:heme NO-binding domain-containing protein [Oceanomicrobium pacificus]|uniref:Heme NO-binding domain-containing protein n=1 Tax=Oceanomicrobium pacificus TaxID=2692916 RepID=A0A6B0TZY1_9RHOB|nr:heme NO-binding domain-containing protein [Oceanomicrobium pacificus]MXU66563.1 hypothetical protein [Oceanomicrobium pacificus]
MLGIVFTEFSEMVEDAFSPEMLDQIIDDCALDNDGAFTAVGAYDHETMLALVGALSARTGMSVEALEQAFGTHLFKQFQTRYGSFFEGVHSAFDMLKRIEDHIHFEVKKLYPNAELPHFSWTEDGQGRLHLSYRSVRPFAPLAGGLIAGCIAHFGEDITMEEVPDGEDPAFATTFILTKG